MAKACGNEKCSVSSTIGDNLSFGSGRLSQHGFWEFPCAPCARAFEEKNPDMVKQYGESWPFKDQDIAKMSADLTQEINEEEEEIKFFLRSENDWLQYKE
jgi:hypothetical protein